MSSAVFTSSRAAQCSSGLVPLHNVTYTTPYLARSDRAETGQLTANDQFSDKNKILVNTIFWNYTFKTVEYALK